MTELEKQLSLIKRGTVEIIREDELRAKLEDSLIKKRPLVIKAGFDPTAPDIHIGHTVLLRKLRHFQELGHKIVFLIGDYTAMIGDPSGVSKTRPQLTKKEVMENARTYKRQISRVLDVGRLKICFNSRWLREKMDPSGIAELMSRYSVTRMLERDDFEKRIKERRPISMLELLYPLLQAYDSVALKSDIEIGGTDQKFNMLIGRTIQERYGLRPQVVITMPILEGLDGTRKMSKSLDNYIGVSEPAKDMFGKLMSISDELMWKYYELLTDEDTAALKNDVSESRLHPKKAKANLARIIVAQYYGRKRAEDEEKNFEKVFKEKEAPEDAPEIGIGKDEINIIDLLSEYGFCSSRAEAKRLLQQGGVALDGERINDVKKNVAVTKEPRMIKAGKLKFARIYRK